MEDVFPDLIAKDNKIYVKLLVFLTGILDVYH